MMRRVLTLLSVLSLALSGASVVSGASQAQNHVHSILVLPTNPNTVYLGGHYRLTLSTDGGIHWQSLIRVMMLSLALDPAHPSRMFGVSLQKGFLKSTDAGRHWMAPASAIPRGSVAGVVFDPSTKAVVAFGAGFYRSTDSGAHWSTSQERTSVVNVAVGKAGTLYAAGGDGLYVSRDGGIRWTSVASVGNQPVIQVAASGHVAYALTPIALLRSSDDGHTWNPLDKTPEGIQYVGASPTQSKEIFGEIADKGFVVSHDGGTTWRSSTVGIRDHNFSASTIQVAPSSPKVIYTGSWGIHFYASRDGGKHWIRTTTLTR